MKHANYEIVSSAVDRLVIRDLGPWDQFPTVTNAADTTVSELVEGGYLKPAQRLFYYDSDGHFDEIVLNEGRFAGFRPGPNFGSSWQ